jgi:hypothetical protein
MPGVTSGNLVQGEILFMWRSRIKSLSLVIFLVTTWLAGCAASQSSTNATGTGISVGVAALASQTSFDPSVDAPMPSHRIVAAYGIIGGGQANGPASEMYMLNAYLPTMRDLAKQYEALDPTHPVDLALDLVISAFDLCATAKCAPPTPSWSLLQPYIDFCQQNHFLLIFDLQLGIDPVPDAIMGHVVPQSQLGPGDHAYPVQYYLQKYPFVELSLDTEFHFPDTPSGYSQASQYARGHITAGELNWAINDLANISMQYHLPRKILLTDQFFDNAIAKPADCNVYYNCTSDKSGIQLNPNVSLVIQMDGFGDVSNKLGDYQAFMQDDLVGYPGYKIFYQYPGSSSYDIPVQAPADVMSLFPQPLLISYQ